MSLGVYTDGNLYVETWIGDDAKDKSSISMGDRGLFHIIEIQQGSTYTQDVTVTGKLPQGNSSSQTVHLIFVQKGIKKLTWDDKAIGLINGSTQRLKCQIEVTSSPGHERVQVSEVELYDYTSKKSSTCYQNIPLEISIQIK